MFFVAKFPSGLRHHFKKEYCNSAQIKARIFSKLVHFPGINLPTLLPRFNKAEP
jgi:hypothetical protein